MLITRILPTVADLVARALSGTDFASEIKGDVAHIRWHAADAIELAAERWEEAHGVAVAETVPSDLLNYATDVLIDAGWELLGRAEAEAEDIRRDAIDAGTINRDGAPVGYATYRRA